jgi:hypothetical protein
MRVFALVVDERSRVEGTREIFAATSIFRDRRVVVELRVEECPAPSLLRRSDSPKKGRNSARKADRIG